MRTVRPSLCKACQRCDDLLVGDLMEVMIVVANGSKKLVIFQAHDLVGLFAHGGEAFGREQRE